MDSPISCQARRDLASPLSPTGPYFAVHLPAEDGGEGRSFVAESKDEALRAARKNRRARFKSFTTLAEAETFAEHGPPLVMTSPPPAAEKTSPFKSPKPAEMVQLRRAVERGDPNEVGSMVAMNPRLLVGSGDTPAVVQEGFRFNCLHIAARNNRAAVAELILGRVADPSFLALMYGEDDDMDALVRRAHVLVDLYLNTPDKVVNETPLHLATKYGAVDTVRVLLSYPQCDRSVKNKKGQTAADLVSQAQIPLHVAEELEKLLCGGVFLAVLRSPDFAVEPLLAELPVGSTPPSPGGREVAALVGPMREKEAAVVRRLWRKPLLTPAGSLETRRLPILVPERRLEAIGRVISAEHHLPWAENWPFLGGFADLRSADGLRQLENYLSARHRATATPIDKLCQALGQLRLSPADDALCHVCIEKTARLYAGKLARALTTSASHAAFTVLLNRIHSLIRSCADDKRYAGVEFDRMHSRLAALTRDEVCNDMQAARHYLAEYEAVNPSFREGGGPNGCLIRQIAAALQEQGSGDSAEVDAKLLWKAASTCTCPLANGNLRSARAKRLDFDHQDDSYENMMADNIPWTEDGYSSDSSDDSCYYTPASSPCMSPSSSSENLHSADETSSVFIVGSEPTRMDAAVYDAIEPDSISPDEFPAIYEWIIAFRGFLLQGGRLPPLISVISPIPSRPNFTSPPTKCASPQHTPLDTRSAFPV